MISCTRVWINSQTRNSEYFTCCGITWELSMSWLHIVVVNIFPCSNCKLGLLLLRLSYLHLDLYFLSSHLLQYIFHSFWTQQIGMFPMLPGFSYVSQDRALLAAPGCPVPIFPYFLSLFLNSPIFKLNLLFFLFFSWWNQNL